MGTLRRALLLAAPLLVPLLVPLLFAGCQGEKVAAVGRVDAVSPEKVDARVSASVTIVGDGFRPRLIADLDQAKASQTLAQFVATAAANDGTELELTDVGFVDAQHLSATWPPGAAPGDWRITVLDPWGRTLEGSATLTVAERLCAADAECDDGLGCTQDRCVEGSCEHQATGDQCAIGGGCVDAGTLSPDGCSVCDPVASHVAFTAAQAGTPCDDGLSCTANDACDGAGSCAGQNSCAADPGGCFEPVGSCEADGCHFSPKQVDSPCEDGLSCTSAETCDGVGHCGSGQWTCASLPPRACLNVKPTVASPGLPIVFDATCSTDVDSPASALQARFDWDSDGVFDTAFGPLTRTHAYGATGLREATVEVMDESGNLDSTTALVAVSWASSSLVVTTGADESDPNATPGNPGGSGFSLREAMEYANNDSNIETILFSGPMQVNLTGPLPTLNRDGQRIFGQPGVELAFASNSGTPCIELGANDQVLAWLSFSGCSAQVVSATGSDDQIAYCHFQGSASSPHAAKFSNRGRFGPGNVVDGYVSDYALQIRASQVVIDHSHFERGRGAIDIGTSMTDTFIVLDEFREHSGPVIQVAGSTSGTQLVFNTFYGNQQQALLISGTAASTWVVNNVFAAQGGCALGGAASAFVGRAPNLVENPAPGCLESAADAGIIAASAQLLDPDGGDLRLTPASPAINAGVQLPFDVNGTSPGNFNGTAPDLGAHESPY